jgi:5'-nucleotidase
MRILLTNDDGIHAPGILAMFRELAKTAQVTVVAPETVQSATGHGITLSGPLLTSKVTIVDGFSGIAVDGSPADCVKLAVAQLLPERVDLVVSGINAGANVGINVVYSGTVAAAIEGAFLGLPSIAVSLHLGRDIPTDFQQAAVLAREAIELVLSKGLPAGHVATINIPALRTGEKPAGTRFVRQCTRPWIDAYEWRQDPRGRDYFWNSSVFELVDSDASTDMTALRDKYVTITPLCFDLTDHAMLKRWQG